MSTYQPIIQNITPLVQTYVTGSVRSIALGGGLGYAFQNGFWHHTPLILLNPAAYNSFQLYVNREQVLTYLNQQNVIGWFKHTVKEIRK